MWKIKVNQIKSMDINITLRQNEQKKIKINNDVFPHYNSSKYLLINLYGKSTNKGKKMEWFLERKLKLSVCNKRSFYKQMIKLVNGIQL